MNLFEHAIEKHELLKFALGNDEYFVADREYGDHSVLNSWIFYILPLIEKKGSDYVNNSIELMIKEILNSKDINDKIRNENLLYHLHVYYYLNSEKRIYAKQLSNLNQQIENSLNEYLKLLKRNNDPKEKAILNALNLIKSRGGLFIANA